MPFPTNFTKASDECEIINYMHLEKYHLWGMVEIGSHVSQAGPEIPRVSEDDQRLLNLLPPSIS